MASFYEHVRRYEGIGRRDRECATVHGAIVRKGRRVDVDRAADRQHDRRGIPRLGYRVARKARRLDHNARRRTLDQQARRSARSNKATIAHRHLQRFVDADARRQHQLVARWYRGVLVEREARVLDRHVGRRVGRAARADRRPQHHTAGRVRHDAAAFDRDAPLIECRRRRARELDRAQGADVVGGRHVRECQAIERSRDHERRTRGVAARHRVAIEHNVRERRRATARRQIYGAASSDRGIVREARVAHREGRRPVDGAAEPAAAAGHVGRRVVHKLRILQLQLAVRATAQECAAAEVVVARRPTAAEHEAIDHDREVRAAAAAREAELPSRRSSAIDHDTRRTIAVRILHIRMIRHQQHCLREREIHVAAARERARHADDRIAILDARDRLGERMARRCSGATI